MDSVNDYSETLNLTDDKLNENIITCLYFFRTEVCNLTDISNYNYSYSTTYPGYSNGLEMPSQDALAVPVSSGFTQQLSHEKTFGAGSEVEEDYDEEEEEEEEEDNNFNWDQLL